MTLKEHEEFYNLVCKKPIDDLATGQATIIDILKGANGDAGLCDDVRVLKKTYRHVMGVLVFILTILSIEIISWVWSGIVARLSGG